MLSRKKAINRPIGFSITIEYGKDYLGYIKIRILFNTSLKFCAMFSDHSEHAAFPRAKDQNIHVIPLTYRQIKNLSIIFLEYST